jgi:hypothetical protein
MKKIQQFLGCTLLAALTALAVYACILVRAAASTVARIPAEIQAARVALTSETDAARRDLAVQIGAARGDLLARAERQAAALRTQTLAEVTEIRQTADRRIGDTLARADTALQTVSDLRADLKPSLDHSAAIAAQVDDALPLFLDCDHNPDCVFNRYVGVSKGIERASQNFGQASQDFRGALPPMLSTWNHIGTDVAGTAGNIDRLTKPHWYDRLLGYGLNGVIMYRDLNPITNLTIKGVQALSGRP